MSLKHFYMQIIANTNSTHYARHLSKGFTDNDQLQAFLLQMTDEGTKAQRSNVCKITQ